METHSSILAWRIPWTEEPGGLHSLRLQGRKESDMTEQLSTAQGCWIIWQFYFSFLRNLHMVFHSGCTNFYSHQQCRKVPFSPHPPEHLLFVSFLMNGRSDQLKWCLVIVCFPLIISDIEHLFLWLRLSSPFSMGLNATFPSRPDLYLTASSNQLEPLPCCECPQDAVCADFSSCVMLGPAWPPFGVTVLYSLPLCRLLKGQILSPTGHLAQRLSQSMHTIPG